jgi:hypothetical protein
VKQQRRGRRIAMSEDERDEFLAEQRVCRVASISARGPHVTPLWFFWDGTALWLNSVVRSQRWVDLQRDPRVAIVIDAGVGYDELRGVELAGSVETVGEVPRLGAPVAELDHVELGFHRKYRDPTREIPYDGKHAWLRVAPVEISSWDFRKNRVLADGSGKS